MPIRLGYACINMSLRKQDIYTGRTLTIEKMNQLGVAAAKDLALKNIADLHKIIEHNESLGIRFFRVTSNLFPHAGNPKAPYYDIKFARDALAACGALARAYGHRITMHPGQYAQLGSPREEVVEQTIRDLNLHADILMMMGMKPELGSVLIIHGGGTYGDRGATLGRWEKNFNRLPAITQKFIALENDDYQYTCLHLLPICIKLNIPLCIDFFHHECLGADQFDIFEPNLMKKIMQTWQLRGIKPKCHWSNQAKGMRKGSHADYIDKIPREILDFAAEYDSDIMCECKMKDECVLKLYEKQFVRRVSGHVYWTSHGKC